MKERERLLEEITQIKRVNGDKSAHVRRLIEIDRIPKKRKKPRVSVA